MRPLTTVAALSLLVIGPIGSSQAAGAKKAASAPEAGGVREPARLTAGTADQFLGTLGPDRQTLYFVSNRNATAQLFAKSLVSGREWLVFDDGADVSFPRISPDGQRILYVSSRDDAGGDVCMRAIDGSNRRCLTGPGTAEVQALWLPDGKSIAVLGRKGLHGDLRLSRVPVGALKASGSTLVDENLTGPAVSPDGKWLAWLPVRRTSKTVGISFAMEAAGGLKLRRLDGGKELPLRFDLPGVTGFAAFSPDSRWLYFTQYLSDTNFDGRIDGDDNAVLFRAPMHPGRNQPVDVSKPQQLTSARHNCQYPQPTGAQLVMTCERRGTLDIFELPPDGAVPTAWRDAKLKEAIEASKDRWVIALLLHRRLSLGGAWEHQQRLLRELVRVHLENGEFSSAAFFAKKVGAAQTDQPKTTQRRAQTWSQLALELVAFGRAARLLNRGELNDRFIQQQRQRLWKLALLGKQGGDDERALARIGMMAIHDVIGEEKRALAAVKGLAPSAISDPFTLRLWAREVAPFLASIGRVDEAVDGLVQLASHTKLSRPARIAMTEQLLTLRTRGRSTSQKKAQVQALRKRVEVDSEAAFRLELEAMLLELGEDNAEDVRKKVFHHYRYHREPERRQALLAATMRAAAARNSGYLMYQFANTWVSMVRRAHAGRPTAEALFKQVLLERAYIDWDRRAYGDARGHFYGVTLQVEDLEAHVGFVETRLREGKHDALQIYAKRFAGKPNHPTWRFVQAYTATSALSHLDPTARLEAIDTAQQHLQAVAAKLSSQPLFHHLRGYLAHQRFLLGGGTQVAVRAHDAYLLALDLAAGNPRIRATLLHALGLLQAAVGNHHLAIDYLRKRRLLPVLHPETDLSLSLASARSLFGAGRLTRALAEAERALKMAQDNPLLKRFLPIVLDVSALYAWRCGKFTVAQQRYQALIASAAKESKPNRLRARLMAAAAALGAGKLDAALAHLTVADRLLTSLSDAALAEGAAPWKKVPTVRVADLQVLADGLRAQALTASGKRKEAEVAWEKRAAGLRAQLKGERTDAVLLALAQAHHDHALLRYRAGDGAGAASLLVTALTYLDQHAERTGTGNHALRVKVALAYAALRLFGKVGAGRMTRDPATVLRTVHAALSARPNPARDGERFAVKTYLVMTTTQAESP